MFPHVGVISLGILALLVFWNGRLQSALAAKHVCYYIGDLLLSLIIPWELLTFGQKNPSVLTLAQASYLTCVVAPFLMRDNTIPGHQALGKCSAVLGSALLLLPTLFLSFNVSDSSHTWYTLILIGEALLLLILGLATSLRIFILSGVALMLVGIISALFWYIPIKGVALMFVGFLLIALSTILVFVRHKLRDRWENWS